MAKSTFGAAVEALYQHMKALGWAVYYPELLAEAFNHDSDIWALRVFESCLNAICEAWEAWEPGQRPTNPPTAPLLPLLNDIKRAAEANEGLVALRIPSQIDYMTARLARMHQ